MKSPLARNNIPSVHKLAVEFDEKKIDAIFAELNQCHRPGAAVGIAIGGKPVYRKGFGLASVELPVILSPTIRMRLGSTTKHFAAFAYMLLCEDGKAGIDDPIGKYLPELHPVTRKVTMRQLMGNISGLRDSTDIVTQFSGIEGRRVSTAELLSFYRDIDDANAAPGTTWNYNNAGWVMLSVAMERITGQPLEDVWRERVFEPVGMYDTMMRRWDSVFVPNSASSHAMNPATGFYERAEFCGGMDFAGAGSIVSTVDDMLRWLAHMDAPRVGSAATWATMKAPLTLLNGTSTGYGLGLISSRYRGVEILHHGGGGLGSSAQMLKVPAAGLDVVVMVNRSDGMGALLANKILDESLPSLDPTAPFNGPFATGIFRSPATSRVIQLFANNGQQIVSIDGFDLPVEREDNGVLRHVPFVSFMKQEVTLIGDPEKPVSIRLSDFGNIDELVRQKPAKDADMRAVVGRYRSDTTGSEVTISETADGPRMRAVGRFGSAELGLECLADGIWRTQRVALGFIGGLLLFDGNGAALRFSNCLTRSLPFRRVD